MKRSPHCAVSISLLTVAMLGSHVAWAQSAPTEQTQAEDVTLTPTPNIQQKKRARALPWFPDWGTADLDWSISPVIGYESRKDTQTKTRISTVEGGLQVGLTDVPLAEGNPGASLSPTFGYAWGAQMTKPDGGDSDTDRYQRLWTGMRLAVPVRFYKNTVFVKYGRISGEDADRLQNLILGNDAGVLVLPFLSTHFTYTHTRAYADSWNEPLLRSHDNWLHVRAFTSFLSAFVDVGPGLTFHDSVVSSQELGGVGTKWRTTDFRLLGGAHLFWKLGAETDFRYIMNTSKDAQSVASGDVRLATDPLGAPRNIVLEPKDTLQGSVFFGLKNLFAGLSLGWRYTYATQNAFERHGDRSTQSRQGIGVHYSASL